jgi:Mg2+-importing ATPase
MIRTRRIPFLQSRPSAALLAATLAVMGVGIFLPMGPLSHYFKFEPLPMAYFPILAGVLLAYVLLTQAMKNFYSARYGWQ